MCLATESEEEGERQRESEKKGGTHREIEWESDTDRVKETRKSSDQHNFNDIVNHKRYTQIRQ